MYVGRYLRLPKLPLDEPLWLEPLRVLPLPNELRLPPPNDDELLPLPSELRLLLLPNDPLLLPNDGRDVDVLFWRVVFVVLLGRVNVVRGVL